MAGFGFDAGQIMAEGTKELNLLSELQDIASFELFLEKAEVEQWFCFAS